MNRIERITAQLKEKYATNDPIELCGKMGIWVLIAQLPEGIRGLYTNILDHKIIYLNEVLDEKDKRIVCAHELGHAVLHTDMNAVFQASNTLFCASRFEHEADLFSAYLLIGEKENLCTQWEGMSTEEIANLLDLPHALVKMRFGQA